MSGKVNFDTLLTFLTKSLYVENSHAFLCFTCILKGNTLNDKLKFPRFGVTLKYRETRVKGTSHICIDKKKEKKTHSGSCINQTIRKASYSWEEHL